MSLSVELPPEPPDRAVVLDRDADAWQRRDVNGRSSWHKVGAVLRLIGSEGITSWSHLVVDRGPLAPMLAESALEAEGWHRAGYATEEAEAFRGNIPGVPPVDESEAPTRAEPDPAPRGETLRFGP